MANDLAFVDNISSFQDTLSGESSAAIPTETCLTCTRQACSVSNPCPGGNSGVCRCKQGKCFGRDPRP